VPPASGAIPDEGMPKIVFPITRKVGGAALLLQGVGPVARFNFVLEAQRSFRKVIALRSRPAAMGYWGLSMARFGENAR